jgi:hypothetical protein
MEHSVHSDRQAYRVVITRRDASEILLEKTGSSYSLPVIVVLRSERIVAQLNRLALSKWNLQTYCLWVRRPDPGDPNVSDGCAIFDTCGPSADLPEGTLWRSVEGLDRRGDRLAVGITEMAWQALATLGSVESTQSSGPFSRPGWIRQLSDWIRNQIHPLGHRLTGEFQQLSGDSCACLIRFETTGPAMWFKAGGATNAREFQITSILARLFRESLPPIVAIHPEWNGWLTQDVSGVTLDQVNDVTVWERVAKKLAELQIACVDSRLALLREGCRDASVQTLRQHIGPFLDHLENSADRQRNGISQDLGRPEFAFVADALDDCCTGLQQVALPDTIVHLDFNFGNLIYSEGACVFLDWAEAAIGNPLTTFEYLRELAKRGHTRGYGLFVRINAAYLRPWHAVVSPVNLAKAFAYSPLIAVFTFALACDRWGEQPTERSPEQVRFLQSLSRRMYRESLRLRNSPCAA